MYSRNFNNVFRNNENFIPIEIEERKIIENDFVMPHHQPEVEIHYITDGTCDYYIDGNKYSAKIGDIVYLKSETVNSMYKSCDTLTFISFTFLSNLLYTENTGCSTEKYFKPLKQGDSEVRCIITPNDNVYDELKGYLFNIKNLFEKKENLYELEIKISLLRYYLALFQNGYVVKISNKEKSKYKSENAICNAIDYINQNFNRSLTVDEIAEYVGISSSHFMKLFREYTHTTCISYINKCRLTKAVELLETTRFNILDVAISVGYNNISLFNRDFKKIYGTTPKEVRKTARIEEKLNKGRKMRM